MGVWVPSMRGDLWQMALTEKALPIVVVACLSRSESFFSVHPTGEPLHEVAHDDLEYDDVNQSPYVHASLSLDRCADLALKAICEWGAKEMKLALE